MYNTLSYFKWYLKQSRRNVYAATYDLRGLSKYYMMHWIVVGCKPEKGFVVHHIDGNGLNNQRKNLKIVTIAENNKHPLKITHSGYPGVESIKPGEWIATINLDKGKTDIGVFATEEEAWEEVKAVEKARERLFWHDIKKRKTEVNTCSRT